MLVRLVATSPSFRASRSAWATTDSRSARWRHRLPRPWRPAFRHIVLCESDVTNEDVEALKRGMQTMPAWPDCKEGLTKLKEEGFRLVTLTNSPPPTSGGKSPLEHAGIAGLFEKQYYIQEAKAYKPAPIVYHQVAMDLDVAPSDCCMVATHVWDTIGGQAAGRQSALITRPGNAVLPIDGLPQPNIVAKDTIDLATKAAAAWQSGARKAA